MQLAEFKTILSRYPDKPLRFVLPNEEEIEPEFHITEVGHAVRNFIDCGGTVRKVEACLLQAWVDENDAGHRLVAGKLAKILELSKKVVPSDQLPVELEYGCCRVSQFAVESFGASEETLTFQLTNKKTDCLAREACGLAPDSSCGCAETKAEARCC